MRLTSFLESPAALNAPALRLQALTPLDNTTLQMIEDRLRRPARRIAAKRDVLAEGSSVTPPLIVSDGWACRLRLLADGRRQIIGFLLPGDIIGYGRPSGARHVTAIAAITDLTLIEAPMPRAGEDEALRHAYDISRALEEAYLYNQIVRLGRQTAYERLSHLMLELHERLALAGLSEDHCFQMPLTQEFLGDTLGLTSVHINRTLQQLRREDMIESHDGFVRLLEPEALISIADFRPAQITG